MILELENFNLLTSLKIFLGSSAVEQVTVNHLVGGSIPSQGAIFKKTELCFIFLKMVNCEEKRTMMASTISRSFFLPIYCLKKIYDLQLELRSSNPSRGEKKFPHKFHNINSSLDFIDENNSRINIKLAKY